jgi:hypothetical protein
MRLAWANSLPAMLDTLDHAAGAPLIGRSSGVGAAWATMILLRGRSARCLGAVQAWRSAATLAPTRRLLGAGPSVPVHLRAGPIRSLMTAGKDGGPQQGQGSEAGEGPTKSWVPVENLSLQKVTRQALVRQMAPQPLVSQSSVAYPNAGVLSRAGPRADSSADGDCPEDRALVLEPDAGKEAVYRGWGNLECSSTHTHLYVWVTGGVLPPGAGGDSYPAPPCDLCPSGY